jgi:hypothetical protein
VWIALVGQIPVDCSAQLVLLLLYLGLRAVVGECPIDEIVDHTDESDVIVDRAVVICRPEQRPVSSVHATRVALHAVIDFGPVAEPFDLFA